ncbi:MAG: hypothetical protein NT149_01730 [Candidatus Gottesmanbacteria bacterium]|nr:hypothetical protein [Candidatus Gottesmanbacteria bacterium]
MAVLDWFSNPNCGAPGISEAKGVATIGCLEPLFANVVVALTALVGVALFIMLIIGGYGFLFSGGDQKKLEKARGTLTAAITGVVVIVVAYLILRTIQLFTGVDVTQFTIPTQ